jgi:hypothetical protein
MIGILGQILFWAGNIGDWYTTKRLVLDKEEAKEVNPILAWIMDKVEKPGKEDMVDLKWAGKMHKAEIVLLALKLLFGLFLYGVFTPKSGMAPTIYFWVTGALFSLVAISNKYNLLGKILNK